MTSPVEDIQVVCPKCGKEYTTAYRASINLNLENYSRASIRRWTTARCPQCKHRVALAALIVDGNRFIIGPTEPESRWTKEQIAADLSAILTSSVSSHAKKCFVSSCLWVWSEYDGKYNLFRASLAARAALAEGMSSKGLRHDHAVPRKLLRDHILQMEEPTVEKLRIFLDRYCIGIAITRDEDAKLRDMKLATRMPPDWDWGGDFAARYYAAGIALVPQRIAAISEGKNTPKSTASDLESLVLGIDCPPGEPRPPELFRMIIDDTGLTAEDFEVPDPALFGCQKYRVKPNAESIGRYLATREILGQRLERMRNAGVIRGALW